MNTGVIAWLIISLFSVWEFFKANKERNLGFAIIWLVIFIFSYIINCYLFTTP